MADDKFVDSVRSGWESLWLDLPGLTQAPVPTAPAPATGTGTGTHDWLPDSWDVPPVPVPLLGRNAGAVVPVEMSSLLLPSATAASSPEPEPEPPTPPSATTLLFDAVRTHAPLHTVLAALDAGADVTAVDGAGCTALTHAAACAHPAIAVPVVTALLAAGAAPRHRSTSHRTPLSMAATQGCAEVIGLLVAECGDGGAVGECTGLLRKVVGRQSHLPWERQPPEPFTRHRYRPWSPQPAIRALVAAGADFRPCATLLPTVPGAAEAVELGLMDRRWAVRRAAVARWHARHFF